MKREKRMWSWILMMALLIGMLSGYVPVETKAADNNLALHRPARASAYLEGNASYPARTPQLAVDGEGDFVNNQNSRWQSGEAAQFSEQWLEVDLGKEAMVSQVTVKFFAKLYGNFVIETADMNTEDAVWETVKEVTDIPSGNETNIIKTVDLTEGGEPVLIKRYIRLRFTSANNNAANRSIAVFEFEVYGTQENDSSGEDELFTGNVAKGKRATASGVEVEGRWTPELAVDGDKTTADSRWSAGRMKNSGAAQSPQWLELDLKNEVTDITEIVLYFHLKVWSTNYEIQTRDSKSEEWQSVKTMQCLSSDETNRIDRITDVSRLGRYVRFYFHEVNERAAGISVSVKEIEVMGTQVQTPEMSEPETAGEVLGQISLGEITKETTKIMLPEYADYEVRVKGSEFPQVISDNGDITLHNIYDYSNMNIIVEAVHKEDESDKAEREFRVTVPKKTDDITLFPEIAKPNEEPKVIPSIQEWYGYEGGFRLSKDSKICIVDEAGIGLEKIANRFAEDMKDITGWDLEITTEASADSGDIVLYAATEDRYDTGAEGYFLVSDDGSIHIESSGYNGCLYGLMTLEQVFYPQKESFVFPNGVIRDYPNYEIRGIMLDIARAPYRLETLQDIVRMLSFYKLNDVQFHLNDNRHVGDAGDRGDYTWWETNGSEGMFRLESDKFPSLMTDGKDNLYYNEIYGGEPQYTKKEYKELQQLAIDYGINPVSEIDGPGHSLLFTKYVREHFEEAKQAVPELTGDIQNERDWELLAVSGEKGKQALAFIKELYSEYLDDEVFLGDVSIGIDEYWNIQASEYDGMEAYIRELSELVKAKGKRVRMWGSMRSYFDNAGRDAKPYNDIVVDMWASNWENANKRISEGYEIINVENSYLYGNPGRDNRDIVNVEQLFHDWDPTVMTGANLKKGEPNLLGAKTALWADINKMGVTERDSLERILRQSAVMCEKTWGGTDEDQTFEEYSFKYEQLREGPAVETGFDIESESDLVLSYDFENVKEGVVYDGSGNDYHGVITGATVEKIDGQSWLTMDNVGRLETTLRSLDYPYTVQFDLRLPKDLELSEDMNLFDSKDGRLTVKQNGNLGLNRSFFDQDFGYRIPKGEKVALTVVGTQQMTKLYVNGKLEATLARTTSSETDYAHLLSTFVFPLNNIGKGMKGSIADIRIYNKAISPQVLDAQANGKEIGYVNVSQDKGAAGVAHRENAGGQDVGWKKLRVGWKALDGDGNALDGTHTTDVSEKDSFFEGTFAGSTFAVDMWETNDISKIVLQWDASPAIFKMQTSQDGKVWTDIPECESITGKAVNVIEFDEPLSTRYLRMQCLAIAGGRSSYQLREFEAYEKTDKMLLEEALAKGEVFTEDLGLTFAEQKEYEIFYGAYVKAKATMENLLADQEEIAKATEQLKTAMENLPDTPGKEADKSDLETLIAYAKEQQKVAEYIHVVPAVKSLFEKALQEAQNIYLDKKATQKAVEDAYEELLGATHLLKFIGNAENLQEAYEAAKAVDYSIYTPNTRKAMEEALERTKIVLDNENALQAEIDEAYKDLRQAIFELREIPNKDRLEELLASVEKIDLSMYKEKSAKAVKAAYEKALLVLKDENVSQKEVDKAVAALKESIAVLEEKENIDTEKKVQATAAKAEVKTKAKTAAKTADNTQTAVWALMLLAAASVCYRSRNHKRIRSGLS